MIRKLLHALRRWNYRSTVTGKFISKADYLRMDPRDTVRERRW